MNRLIFLSCLFGLTSFVRGEATRTCSVGEGVGQLSDADFWKGVDGAQYITELTDETHDQFGQENPKAFVMYYTTWCGYSKKARQGFAGAAKKLNAKVKFGAVDCDQNSASCKGEHAVRGYPTFYLYKDGSWAEQYQGQRTTNAFVSYLSKK